MRPIHGVILRVVALVVGSSIIGASIATNPATAQDVNSMLGAIGLTTCSKVTPCKKYTNNGSGAGLEGVGGNGNGLIAQSINGSATFSTSTNADGVQAFSTNNDGTNSGTNNNSSIHAGRSGVWGHDDSTDGGTGNVGVAGSSNNGLGVSGSSTNESGVQGSSTNWLGVAGDSGYIGVYGNGGARGADITGGLFGVIGRAPAGSGTYPLLLTDQFNNLLAYLNGDGDMYVHGTYNNFARVRDGNTVVSYGAKSASPSIEDTGSGQLVNGIAIVNLDMTFAQAIDPHQVYHVMLTPDGDTRGLFVASKSPNQFVVREVQGGHGSLSFDYHIYAATLGQANERMFMMTPAQTKSFMPRAAIVAKHPSKVR
jgi:hypothetical protein